MTYNMTQKHKFADWEIAELNYVLSLAAISDYRYIIAINHVQDALLYFNAIVQPKRSIECLIVLGIAQKHTENVDDAIETFKKANEIMFNTNTLQYQGVIEQNLGACYSLLKDSIQSLRHFKRSIEVKIQPEEKFITILSIIKEYKKIGETRTAKNWLNRGLALLTELKKYEDSPYYYHFSIHKALLYESANLISTFEATLKYFESKQNYYQCFIYCHILAKQIAENNQFKLATTYYQKAFDFHLKYRKVSFWEELT